MCNLNLFVKTEELDNEDLLNYVGFIVASTSNSYVGNDDGDGMYFNGTNKLVKSKNKVNPLLYIEDIASSNITLTHQRISTSGRTEEYTQPFENNEFVLAHNGVLSDFVSSDNKHSDTYNMFDKFKEEFVKNVCGDRTERMKKSIQAVFDGMSGSYSIFIYDKIGKKLYYFKNNSTSITLSMNKKRNIAYMTTDDDNNKMLTLIGDDFKEFEVEHHRIYEISVIKDRKENKYISVRKIGKIKEHECVYTPCNRSYNYDCYSKSYNMSKEEKEEFDEYNKVYQSYNKQATEEEERMIEKIMKDNKVNSKTKKSFYSGYEMSNAEKYLKVLGDEKISIDLAKLLGLTYYNKSDTCYICGKMGKIYDDKTGFCSCNDCIENNYALVLDELYNINKKMYPDTTRLEAYNEKKDKINDTNKKISEIVSRYKNEEI